MIPYETQLVGADFLANKTRALLADAPRCGKTGAGVQPSSIHMENALLARGVHGDFHPDSIQIVKARAERVGGPRV